MSNDDAKKTAQNILNDRHGANYYQDLTILSEYLERALGMTNVKAGKISKAIQEDRNGANYYEDAQILANFLGK